MAEDLHASVLVAVRRVAGRMRPVNRIPPLNVTGPACLAGPSGGLDDPPHPDKRAMLTATKATPAEGCLTVPRIRRRPAQLSQALWQAASVAAAVGAALRGHSGTLAQPTI